MEPAYQTSVEPTIKIKLFRNKETHRVTALACIPLPSGEPIYMTASVCEKDIARAIAYACANKGMIGASALQSPASRQQFLQTIASAAQKVARARVIAKVQASVADVMKEPMVAKAVGFNVNTFVPPPGRELAHKAYMAAMSLLDRHESGDLVASQSIAKLQALAKAGNPKARTSIEILKITINARTMKKRDAATRAAATASPGAARQALATSGAWYARPYLDSPGPRDIFFRQDYARSVHPQKVDLLDLFRSK